MTSLNYNLDLTILLRSAMTQLYQEHTMQYSHPEPGAYKVITTIIFVLVLFAASSCVPQMNYKTPYIEETSTIQISAYANRRARMLEMLSDGILLIHARSTEKEMEQWGFVQDATFLYYSGLSEVPGAIIALDGLAGTAHLFLPP